MKTLAPKKPAKDQRERLVLLGLVELYLQTGKPVGSNTLRENGFDSLSSATIRNYFMKLEEEGYLKQQHSSGGRTPTSLAYQLYAESQLNASVLPEKEQKLLRQSLSKETREIVGYLQEAAELISNKTKCSVFLSAPRFDQDFILDIKLIGLDNKRCLCVLITDFGLVHTEMLYAGKKLSNFTLKRIESYLRWKITHLDRPDLSEDEEETAQLFYNEIMLRHIVNYTHFSAEDIYKTGLSKLLDYPDFNDASALAGGLALFENQQHLRKLLATCTKKGSLSCWIGDELAQFYQAAASCSVIAVPYRINQTIVGALAILGPSRMPYRQLFGYLRSAAECMSETLTKSIYKFKISFRQPEPDSIDMKNASQAHRLLIENKNSE